MTMAEYIERNAAIEAAKHAWAKGLEPSQYIEILPAVDAEVVVRCKDCYQSVVIGDVLYCAYWRKNTDENGYCHEGG
jgi:hypothetical protein